MRFLIILIGLNFSLTALGEEHKAITIRFSQTINKSSINSLIKRIEKSLKKSESDFKEVIVSLDSPGGDMNQAIRAVRFMRSSSRSSHIAIHTKVSSNSQCESACTILFTGGEKRFAGERAQFGFHSPKYVTGELDNYSADQIEELFRRKWLEEIKNVDPLVAEEIQVKRYLYSADMSYLKGLQLQTGYVTDIL